MATYNGINYIKEQVDSIVPQLIPGDEFLISDDGSTDGTWEYLLQLESEHKAVRIMKGPCKGANANFFNLFSNAVNDIIFISDQDDIWFPNKIDKVVDVFNSHPNIEVVLHKDIIKHVGTGREEACIPAYHGLFVNLLRNSYSGHRMAFRKELRDIFIQDISLCPAYDQYIGLLAEKTKCGYFIDDILDYHIIHNNNISRALSIKGKFRIRIQLLKCLIKSFV